MTTHFRWGRLFWAVVLLLAGGTAIAAFVFGGGNSGEPEVSAAAWQKVKPHLDRLDRQAEEARNRRLAALRTFFRERERGPPASPKRPCPGAGNGPSSRVHWESAKQMLTASNSPMLFPGMS